MSPPRPPIISWSLDNPPFACTLSAGEKEDEDEDDAFFPNEVDCDFNADRLRRMEFAVSVVADDAFKLCEIIVTVVAVVVSLRNLVAFKTQEKLSLCFVNEERFLFFLFLFRLRR